MLSLALGAFQLEHNLLGGLSLLVENGLGLTTETGLLVVVTTLTLGGQGVLTLLVPFAFLNRTYFKTIFATFVDLINYLILQLLGSDFELIEEILSWIQL